MFANICKFIKFIQWLWQKSGWQNRKKHLLEQREYSLILAGVMGIVFAGFIYCVTSLSGLDNEILQSSLTLLALGLPTFFILWIFRTYDVQRQLDKTQENTNNSTFFECARMLASEKAFSQKVALEKLAYLKRETGFDKKRIDMLTRKISLYKENLDLQSKENDFRFAQFSGLNLSEADLQNVNLLSADLRGADLRGADLEGANLVSVDLEGANLKGAILARVVLLNAKYNQDTKFPGYFDPKEAGMILVED